MSLDHKHRQEGLVTWRGNPDLSSVVCLVVWGFRSLSLFLSLFDFLCCSVIGTALENEILRNPKPSLVDRSVLSSHPDRLLPPDVYVDAALLRKPRAACDGDLSEAGPALRGPRRPRSRAEAPEHDSGLVSGALARIRELEQEAERLEEAYRSHQQRAVHAVSAEDLPLPRTTSGYRVTFASVGRPVEKGPLEGLSRTPSPRERNPLRLLSPPARRLSSTPLSESKHRAHSHQDLHSFTQGTKSSATGNIWQKCIFGFV